MRDQVLPQREQCTKRTRALHPLLKMDEVRVRPNLDNGQKVKVIMKSTFSPYNCMFLSGHTP